MASLSLGFLYFSALTFILGTHHFFLSLSHTHAPTPFHTLSYTMLNVFLDRSAGEGKMSGLKFSMESSTEAIDWLNVNEIVIHRLVEAKLGFSICF